MRSLPPLTVGHRQLILPCPEDDLIALVGAWNESDPYLGVSKALRRSPTLLVFSLHHLGQHQGEPPPYVRPLVAWTVEHLPQILSRDPEWEFGPIPHFVPEQLIRAPLKSFAAAKGNRSIRRSLATLVDALFGGDNPQRELAGWINAIVGKAIRADEFECDNQRELYLKLKRNWCASSSQVDLRVLLKSVQRVREIESSFDARLREEKLAAMKQLAYGASHEINNPLANIASRAQSLLADELNPERRRKLATIYEQAMRAHEMISDMMLFAHPTRPSFRDTNLYELVKRVAHELRPKLRESGIRLRVVQYPNCRPISCDETQIAVAVKAVIQNSIDAINSSLSSEGRIDVRVWFKTEQSAAISIVDNGPGVDGLMARHIFDPFYSGREAGRGLGFGLAKAWTIVNQLHGGSIALVPSENSSGAEFQITLPCAQTHSISNEPKDSKPSAA